MTTRGVSRSAGDYNGAQLARANADLVEDQVTILLDALRHRRKGMVFAVTVEPAVAFRDEIRRQGAEASLIVGAMSAAERDAAVEAFAAGPVPLAVTVSAALTGFDMPAIDLIASCRPTVSPIVHTQSIGRGTRVAAGKTDCLVLDFAGNVARFGPVHRPHFDHSGQPLGGMAPCRPCLSCGTCNHQEEPACSHCGSELVVRRPVKSVELEYGIIAWGRETKALQALVDAEGWTGLPVESLALHAYRKRSDPTSVSCRRFGRAVRP